MKLPDFLLFASDAELMAYWGVGFVAVAIFAMTMEKRRNRRDPFDRIEKVGLVPWTTIFVLCMIIGGGLLATALPRVIAGN